ncbi:ankyrin repeat domain-containing protein [Pedobacter jamesrossensis]|uniref:Ankyrin repeat domain-containing protein n=1 Tax=Pedobacter jamesrossensis TaxID=1908238 RepID=A0ABV8NKS2_9SPHI
MNQDLEKLLYENKFTEAAEMVNTGHKLPKTLLPHQLSQIFDNLFKAEQYELILHFVKDKTIETDIYEFDNFERSVFQTVERHLKTDENGLTFFRDFISRFENLNDEVSTQTLLGYFLEKLVSADLIKILIETGCNVNFKNNAEETYIHQIIRNNQRRYDLDDEALNDLKISYINIFLDEGLDINAENIVGKTPLIQAIESNKPKLIAFLMEHGADANHLDKTGNSAFFYAVAHLQSVEMYAKMSAFTQPQLDVLNKDQVTILFDYLRMISPSANGILLLKKLIEDGADLYQPSIYYGKEKTPMDLIAEKPTELLEAIIETGQVDVNRGDDNGNTLLHKVCAFNVNYDASNAKETYKKVKLLIENGADVSITNDQDQTALMLASDDNLKIKTVELLMKQS